MFAGKLVKSFDNVPKSPVNKIEIKKEETKSVNNDPIVADNLSIGLKKEQSIKNQKVYKRRESNHRMMHEHENQSDQSAETPNSKEEPGQKKE